MLYNANCNLFTSKIKIILSHIYIEFMNTNFGFSSRLSYDNNAYKEVISESTAPINYRMNVNYIHNNDRCLQIGRSSPRTTTIGFGVNTVGKPVGCAVVNELVDADSIMSNRNVPASKTRRGHVNPINLTLEKSNNYGLCSNKLDLQYTALTDPRSNYRGQAVSRFYDPLNDPQENIFISFAHNTRLEAKDNYKVDLPELWEDKARPKEYKGPKQQCGLVCKNK